MDLHIIRHGRTIGNHSGLLQGWTDSSLLPEQTEYLRAVAFDSTPYDAIYSSDSGRCRETCNALRLPDVIEDRRLRERHFGVFENAQSAVLRERFPREYARFTELSAEDRPPGGETRTQHFERLQSWIQSVQHRGLVLVVGHGGMLDLLYRLAVGLNLHGEGEIFDGANAAKSEFRITWPSVELVSFSRPLDA